MAFYGYKGDVGECHWTHYSTPDYCYYNFSDVLPRQSAFQYSSYEFDEPIFTEYSTPYDISGSYSTQQVSNYFAYNLSEGNLIQYEPPPSYAVHSFYSQTNQTISYSNTEFDEYDPTPYGGGYDLAQTYGKPLPPSDEICYPRSRPKQEGESPAGFSNGSLPASALGERNQLPVKPDEQSKPVATKDQESDDGVGEKIAKGTEKGEDISPKKALEEAQDDGDEHVSSDHGKIGGDYEYGYEWNAQVPYAVPYGSGLESIDLCESIFGYWPCLDKIERQRRRANSQLCDDDQESRNDPWKSTADYLFGSPFVYGEQQNGGIGSPYQPHINSV